MEPRFGWIGGALSLDFMNTVSWHTGREPYEHLPAYADLVSWSRQAGVIDERRATSLAGMDGTQVLRRAIDFREAGFRTFLALLDGAEPAEEDLSRVNAAVEDALAHGSLAFDGRGMVWRWQDVDDPERLLWPVVKDAADLLVSDRLVKVSICDADSCGWLFLDVRGRRRWCSMESCGNRAKAARHYRRTRPRGEG